MHLQITVPKENELLDSKVDLAKILIGMPCVMCLAPTLETV